MELHGRRHLNGHGLGKVREEGEPGGFQGSSAIGLATADALDSFNHDRFLFTKRVGVAILFVSILNALTLFAFSIPFHATNFSEYGIFAFVISPWNFLTTFGSIVYFAIGLIVIPLIIGIHSRQLAWRKPEYGSRIEYGKAIVRHWRYIPNACSLAICGVLLIKSYLKILDLRFVNFVYLKGSCPPEVPESEYCCDEGHLFILYCVFFVSIVYFVNFRFTHRFVVRFLTFAYGVDIWYQVKHDIKTQHLGEALSKTFMALPFMYFSYFILGNSIRAVVAWLFRAKYVIGPIDSFWDMLSFQLFVFTIFSCVLVLIVYKVAWQVLEICLTTRIAFPVDVTQSVPGKMLLVDALGYGGYVRMLAHFDFMCLSDGEFPRYEQIYKMNERSGSPVTWNALVKKTLSSIRAEKEKMDAFIAEQKQTVKKRDIAKARAKPRSTLLYSTKVPTELDEAPDAKTLRQRNLIYKQRDLSETPTDDRGHRTVQVTQQFYTPRLPTLYDIHSYLVAMFRKSKYGVYFFEVTLESRISALLADSQFLIWDLHSMVNICIDTFRSKREAVFQKGLVDFIYLLIDYYETFLEFRRITGRVPTDDDGPWSSSMLEQEHLHDAIKFAVSQIAYNFRYCKEMVELDPDYMQKLKDMSDQHQIPEWILKSGPVVSPDPYAVNEDMYIPDFGY